MKNPVKRVIDGKEYTFERSVFASINKINIVADLREKGKDVRAVKGGSYLEPYWNIYVRG